MFAMKKSNSSPPPSFKITNTTQLEDWKKWQRTFRYYANSINLEQESHDVQLCVFKSLLGPDALEIYDKFSLLDISDVESVIRKFDEHFKPKANITLERFKFYQLHQKAGQLFEDFLSDITNLVDRCEFNSMRDEIMVYKIVGGIENNDIRERLLEEANLKYEKALQICQSSSAGHHTTIKNDNCKRPVRNGKKCRKKQYSCLNKYKKRKSETGNKEGDTSFKNENISEISESEENENKSCSHDDGDSDWRADDDCPDVYDNEGVVIAKVGNSKKRRRTKKRSQESSPQDFTKKNSIFDCISCGKTCRSKMDYKRHMMTHIPGGKVSCHHCGGRYKQKRYLVRHIVRSHPGMILSKEAPKIFVCDECGYKTNQSANMRRHKYQHTEERPFSCELCEYKCIVPRLMRAHMAKHTGEKPLVCKICPKGFLEANALKKHMLTHMPPQEREKHLLEERESSSRPFGSSSSASCEMCGKVFSSKSALKTHSVVHTGERPFACTVCDYRAGQKAALNAHMAKHSEEKPFVCTVCGYSCKLKRVLQVHMNTHTGDRPYACTMCDNKFKQIAHLQVHMRTHTGEKPYVCDICGHRWAKQSNLTQHMKVHQNQAGDPSQFPLSRKRQKKRKVDVPTTETAPPSELVQPTNPAIAPTNAIPPWSEQVSAINPMECFLNLETPPPFHPTYSTPQGNLRPPDCRYFQQRPIQTQDVGQNPPDLIPDASDVPIQLSLDNPTVKGPRECRITENVGLPKMSYYQRCFIPNTFENNEGKKKEETVKVHVTY